MKKEKTPRTADIPASLEGQQRLAEIMNDSPRIVSFQGTEWEVRALRPGTQWLIAEEAVKIQKKEDASYADIIKSFSTCLPSVVKVITLCLLNDRQRIFANGRDGEFSEEYRLTYDTIMWNTSQKFWLQLLLEILELLDITCFFGITNSIQILRRRTTERKMTEDEQKLSLRARASGK